jgi:hypothetical protein
MKPTDNLKDINFWNESEEYKLEYLKRHYKIFLNTLVTALKDKQKTTNKVLHAYHKQRFGPFSLKDNDLDRLVEFMKNVDELWNKELGLTFMP